MLTFAFVKSLIFGGLQRALDYRRDVKIAKMKADGETNNIVKDLELKRLENESQAIQHAKEVRIATKDHWEIRLATGLVAVPMSLHVCFTAVNTTWNMGWDIKQLPSPLDEWQAIIILGYLFQSPIRQGINVAAAALLKR